MQLDEVPRHSANVTERGRAIRPPRQLDDLPGRPGSRRRAPRLRLLGGDEVRPVAPGEHAQQRNQSVAQLRPLDDLIDCAVREQVLGCVAVDHRLLVHGLLDHARTGEADQRFGLGDDHVPQAGEAGVDAAGGGIGQDRDEGLPRFVQLACRGGRLGHLHEGQHALLHARAAARGHGDDGQPPPGGELQRQGDLLTHH